MILLPAIDLQNGECVRLVRGEFSTARKVAEDAVQTAQKFQASGAEWLHIVDLDAAKKGKPVHAALIQNIRKNCGLKLEIGGGIRNMALIDAWLKSGIARVILGTAAVRSPEFAARAVKEYGDRIAVGIDARGGMAAQEGWTETTAVRAVDLAKRMEQIGVRTLIVTDIARDGTLGGPNLELLGELKRTVSCDIIASGGIADQNDIKALLRIGLAGAVCGKSLYAGTLDLRQAIALCREQETCACR